MKDPEPVDPDEVAVEPADPTTLAVLEMAAFLSARRASQLRCAHLNAADLSVLGERLAAHLDVLVVRGKSVVEWLIKLLPAAESPEEICNIARVLLESHDALAARSVLAALEAAKEEPIVAGLVKALCQGPLVQTLPSLQTWFRTAAPRLAAAAAEVLAYHRGLEPRAERLTQLLEDADPLVRRAAWRAAALAG